MTKSGLKAAHGHLCIVSFDLNYPDATIATQGVPDGLDADRPETEPVRAGYKFLGWYASDDATLPYDFSAPVNANLTLTARWLALDPQTPAPTASSTPAPTATPAPTVIPPQIPKTGDPSHPAGLLLLLVFSAVTLALIGRRTRQTYR